MKTIQFLLFFLALTFNVFAQTDPLSYHTTRQLSDSSYSMKKANGDSTIFLFEGGNSDSAGYRTMSVNADSTQVIWQGLSQPADTLEIWGMGGNSDSGYASINQQNDSTIIFQRDNGLKDTVVFSSLNSDNTGNIQLQPDWNQADNQQPDFIKNKPAIPAQFNAIAGSNITLSGTYPDITINASGGSGGISQSQLDDSTAAIRNDFPDTGGNNNAWSLTGNAGTTSSDFIGTTDNVELMFKVNNVLAGRTGIGSFSNTSFGAKSQPITGTGLFNVSFGSLTSASLRSGAKNTDIGYEAGFNNLTGNYNTRVGEGVNIWDTSSSYNTVLGTEALNHTSLTKIAGGGYNTALGALALNKHAIYRSNIGLGYYAGNGLTGNNTLFVSDSAYHMYFKLDSATGTAPNVIGKDGNGNWHVYQLPTNSTSLLKHGSVPFAGPSGSLIQDSTGLVYDGNNLQVGHSNFNNTVGLFLNGGRAQLTASGFGATFSTSGGFPADASKSISFYNSQRPYLKMYMASDSSLNLDSYMNLFPHATNTYNLGTSSNEWNSVYAKQLYLNGVLFTGASISGTAILVSGTVTVSTTLVKTGARIFVSVNSPSGTQGFLSAPTSGIINGTSFVINSTSGTENSTVNWQITNQ